MSDFNQNNDDEDIVVTLDLDDGSQVECEILTIFTVGERDYIALLPLDENGEENEEDRVDDLADPDRDFAGAAFEEMDD